MSTLSRSEKQEITSKITRLEGKLGVKLLEIAEFFSQRDSTQRYVVGETVAGAQGRLPKDIGIEQLETLLELGFTLVAIAALLGIIY